MVWGVDVGLREFGVLGGGERTRGLQGAERGVRGNEQVCTRIIGSSINQHCFPRYLFAGLCDY